jgi:PGF-pre-PGF domain-containing protein
VTATVENTGNESGTFTAELTENGTVVASQDVTVAAGATETVSFVRTYQTAGTYELGVSGTTAGVVTVEQPATFDVTTADLNQTTITEGDSVEVTGTIANTGDQSGTFTAELTENGTVVASQDVTVSGGTTETVTFVRTYQTAGAYDLAVSGTTGGVVTVEQSTPFDVTTADLNQTTITEGESVEISATIENTGDQDGTFTTELTIDEVVVDSQDVAVAAGTTETVTFVRTFDQAGDYAIAVSGTSAGTLTVEDNSSGGGGGVGGGTGGVGGGAGGGGFSGGGGVGSGASGGGAQNTTENETVENDTQTGPPTADVTASDDGVVVSIPESTNGTSMSANLNGTISNDAFSITQLEFDVVPASDQFRLEMQQPSADSGPAPPLSGATSLGYVEINHDEPGDGTFEAVDFRFTVTRAQLADGRSYDDVRLYRYSDGSWHELETRHDGDGRFVATSPGFSVFAVGVKQADAPGQVAPEAHSEPRDVESTPVDNTESSADRTGDETTDTHDESGGVLADARSSGLPVAVVLSLVVLGIGMTYRLRESSRVRAAFTNWSPGTTRGSESVQPDDTDWKSEADDSDKR